MSEILSLAGPPALSNFRLAKLLQGLTASLPTHHVASITAAFRHFVEVSRPLSSAERSTLDRLLTYGPEMPPAAADAAASFLVVPRPGTHSPWSSKATDIAKNCGLAAVKRIERGGLYGIVTASGAALTAEDRAALLPLLHDRMIEAVLAGVPHPLQPFPH